MRRADLSSAQQRYLVKCNSHPNCHALIAPPTPRRLPDDAAVAHYATHAMQALERLKVATDLLPNGDMVTRTLARREAVQSSQIEGTRTQLHELFEYEATQRGDGLPPDATVTERYVQALEHGLSSVRAAGARNALSAELVRAMHGILMQDAPAHVRAGQYRTTQAWIGSGRIEDAVFVPAPPDRIGECMGELEHSMLQYSPREDEQWQIPVAAQIAIAHAQFETIQPFVDGNGRSGRLLMPLILAAEGYPPLYISGRLLRHRRAYYDALADVQLRANWGPWMRLLCQSVIEASDGAIAIAKDLNAIRENWLSRLAGLRADATALRLPTFLLGHPVVSVKQIAKALEISFVAANRAIDQLVERGILGEPEKRRNRVFHASEVLTRLEQE
ncbi:MAG TPA: Fic/DOC family N-terminal domain-containing protein [Xanthomonadales bacterium]|nr:Fic/DOC family N-terminal domain-containing protein [Xanthomonadales bacterium]